MSQHTEADQIRQRHVRKLFDAFERGVSDQRAARYVEALRGVDVEKLREAVAYFIQTWEKASPPPVAKLRSHAQGVAEDAGEEADRLKWLRYCVERYSDEDQHIFRKHFGFVPSRETFVKFDLPIPPSVRFIDLDMAHCNRVRRVAHDSCMAAVRRLYGQESADPKVFTASQCEDNVGKWRGYQERMREAGAAPDRLRHAEEQVAFWMEHLAEAAEREARAE